MDGMEKEMYVCMEYEMDGWMGGVGNGWIDG